VRAFLLTGQRNPDKPGYGKAVFCYVCPNFSTVIETDGGWSGRGGELRLSIPASNVCIISLMPG